MDKRRDRALKKVSARAESRGVLRTTRQKTSTIQAVKAEQSHSKHKLYRLFRRNISTENINYTGCSVPQKTSTIQAVQSHRKHKLYRLFRRNSSTDCRLAVTADSGPSYVWAFLFLGWTKVGKILKKREFKLCTYVWDWFQMKLFLIDNYILISFLTVNVCVGQTEWIAL